jgi:PAS domain S-box-containing protein
MSNPELPSRRVASAVLRYGLSVLLVLCALLATLLINPDTLIAPLFFLAILPSAWVGGMGPGLAAASLATLAVAYFFLPPKYSLWFNLAELPQLLAFFLPALVVSWWSTGRKRTETLLRQARDELEAKVEERTADLRQSNEQLRTEIAERKRAEETLREQANLLNLTHDTIFVRDMDGAVKYWNRGAEELYGWMAADAAGKATHDLLHTIFPAPLEEINAELLRTGRWEGELVHTRKDGTQVVVASRWALRRDARGAPVAILETNNDITERRHVEQALRESEEQWKAAFESNPTMYFMIDAAGAILSVNPFGAEQLGYTVDELVGHSVLHVFYEADREAVQRHADTCFAQLGRTLQWEARKIRKDSTMLRVRETAKAVVLKNRPVLLVVCEDITERRRAEEALRRAQAELAHTNRVTTLGELTASIAHEVNQPLAAVVTNGNAGLRWLASQPPSLDEARECLRRIVRDGARAGEVIRHLRTLVKRAALTPTRVDLTDTVQDVLALITPEARRRQVAVRTELAPTLPPVRSDRVQLQQVLLNLAMNGIEAMQAVTDRPRELVLRARPDGARTVLIAVHDSGIGLDEQSLGRLFEAFYTTKPDGLGMGLAISRSIIEAHGGRLWATANGDYGATFQFTLPTDDRNQQD